MTDDRYPSEEGATDQSPADSNKVHHLPLVSYDESLVEDFLARVFHADFNKTEEILTWNTAKIPGYPKTEEGILLKLSRSKKREAYYYGTSTCRRDHDGTLYNRKTLFERLHVVVLDDIGTKIDKANLPNDLTPSYVIESSEGNEQWGFILKEPIDDIDQAQMFVTLVYHSGFTDTGGNMPTKLVRLPCGYNMKPGQEDMPVTLLNNDGPLWEPDDLLRVLQTGVRWDDIVNNMEQVRKNKLSWQGATVWSPAHIEACSVEGIVDPGLEWMYEQGMVYQERGDWVDIRCPWHNEHSTHGPNDDRAGYSPLGWGGDFANSRGFNCFHGTCKGNNRDVMELLEYIASNGGPELPRFDYVPELLSGYVYDPTGDCVWPVTTTEVPSPWSMSAMRNVFARPIRYATQEGKIKSTSPVNLWMTNPARVLVNGAEYNPGVRTALFRSDDASLKVNLFRMESYEDYPIDRDRLKVFYDYVEYLIPIEEEREYFLDWLACKVQDPCFRGPALFMVADAQGTGRNTLTDMIGLMFGQRHVKHVPFHRLIGGGAFNEFQESLFVVVDETLAVEDLNANRRATDILKDLIDPRPQHARINPKYGKPRDVWSVSSYIFLSNHDDGLKLSENDRRFYAIRNARKRAEPEYFGAVNAWINEDGWQKHLWNDLLRRPVNPEDLAAPPEATETMMDVISAGHSAIDLAVQGFVEAWPTRAVPRSVLTDVVNGLAEGSDAFPLRGRDAILRRLWKQAVDVCHRDMPPLKVGGKQYRFGVKEGDRMLNAEDVDEVRTAIESYDRTAIIGKVLNYMAAHGMEL